MRITLILAIAFLFFSACKTSNDKDKGRIIARVQDAYLYESDLSKVVPGDISNLDSMVMVKSYASNWVEQQVLLQSALVNLSESEQDVEKLVEKYRNSLLIFKYETKYLRSRLDTTVSDFEISDHYKENRDNFVLNQPVFRIRFLEADSLDPFNYKYWKWIKSDLSDDLTEMESHVEENDYTYIKGSSKWYSKSDMLAFFPDTDNSLTNILAKLSEGVYTKYHEGNKLYLCIDEVKNVGDTSPMQLATDEIRLQIVNKRRTDLTRKLRLDAVNNALNKKNAELFMDNRP